MPLERFDPRARFVGHRVRRRHDQVTVRALLRAADAPAELVELREAEEVRAVDDHRVRARDVEPALDDRRRDEDVVAPLDEVEHHLLRAPSSPRRSVAPICPWATAMRAVGTSSWSRCALS